MDKFFKNKFAVLAVFLSVFSVKTSGLNVNEIAEKTTREDASLVTNLSSIKTSGVQQKSLSNPLKYALLPLGAAGAAGLGALGYHVTSSLFGEVAQGRNLFIKYYKFHKANKFTFSLYNMSVSFSNSDLLFLSSIRTFYQEIMKSELKGEKLDRAVMICKRCFDNFYQHYQSNLVTDLFNIAYKYSEDRYASKCSFMILVKPIGGELSVRLLNKEISHDTSKGLVVDRDVTAEFNIENPKNDEEKRKKGFYDALVKYVNNDDVMKQILLNT